MVKRVLGIATILMISSFFMSCDESGETRSVSPRKSTVVSKSDKNKVLPAVEFKVPATTALKAEKIKQYMDASNALMILGAQWSEQIEKAEDQEKVTVLNNYTQAREQVCIRVGLAGMAEFNWLDTVAVRAPENAEVLKTAGIQVP